jgi:hypothetical protein
VLLALLQKGAPKLRNLGFGAGRCKIIYPASDDLIARKSKQLAGAGAGVPIIAVVVRNQDWCSGVEYNRPEELLEFSRTVFDQPTGGFRL